MDNPFGSTNNKPPQLKEDFAYEMIKEAIISGELRPNQQISLSTLSKQLGVSIIPVNQAIRRLISEGLVKQDPHHSPCVEEFSAGALEEILTVRYHLEELAMREAIPHIGPEEMKVLRQAKVDMDNKIQSSDMHAYGIANRAFHMKIYSYCFNQLLYDLIDDLWNKAELNRSRSVFALVNNMAEHSQFDHENLLDLIEDKKIDEALQALHYHRIYSRDKLLEKIK
jgi:DNA-binding GntR family transcriptional regulator